ncbi:hypothetical protein [Paenibacillus gansuensis]|uniref:NEAT domain-containing protein n=1 Tax=Paenibacillus gansuensis TaxID=306542 RepID=A0ABW5PJJ9_9BACL
MKQKSRKILFLFTLVLTLSLAGISSALASPYTDFVNPRGTLTAPASFGEIEDIVFNQSGSQPASSFSIVYSNTNSTQIYAQSGNIATNQGSGYILYNVPSSEFNALPKNTVIKVTVKTYNSTGGFIDSAVTYITAG